MCQENSAFLEYLSQISIILASLTAIYGVNTWRREYRGKKDIELAEETLVLFYRAKDAISAIRNPLGFSGEGASRKPAENETEAEKRVRDQAYAFYERFEKRQDVFNSLLSMRYRFMARFGKSAAESFDSIHRIVNEIMISADYWAEMRIARDESDKEEMKRVRRIIWYSGKDDQINAQVEKTIETIENICKPIITKTYSSTFTNAKIYFKKFMSFIVSVVKKWKRR